MPSTAGTVRTVDSIAGYGTLFRLPLMEGIAASVPALLQNRNA